MNPYPNEPTDADSWVVPLHGLTLPETSADAGAAPPILGIAGPGSEGMGQGLPPHIPYEADAPMPVLDNEELPFLGFHPRLRRSA